MRAVLLSQKIVLIFPFDVSVHKSMFQVRGFYDVNPISTIDSAMNCLIRLSIKLMNAAVEVFVELLKLFLCLILLLLLLLLVLVIPF